MSTKNEYHEACFLYEELLNTVSIDFPIYRALIKSQNPSNILEVGCGLGRLFKIYSKFPKIEITGIDLSKKMLYIAEKNYKNIPNKLTLIEKDILKFNTKKTFDMIIIAASLLKHFKEKHDRMKIINKIKNLVSKNGIIFLDHTPILYYCKNSDWNNAKTSFFRKWSNKPKDLNKYQWKKKFIEPDIDKLIWRKFENNTEILKTEFTTYYYSISELTQQLKKENLYYIKLLDRYEDGVNAVEENYKRFIAIIATNNNILTKIEKQFHKYYGKTG